MKTCSNCKQTKLETQFSRKTKTTLQSKCKECTRLYSRTHYQNNSAKYKTRIRERETSLSTKFQAYKAMLKCEVCGEDEPVCLDFHHHNSKNKEIHVSLAVERGWCWERVLKEIAKCQVLCVNCHRKLHWEEREEKKKAQLESQTS